MRTIPSRHCRLLCRAVALLVAVALGSCTSTPGERGQSDGRPTESPSQSIRQARWNRSVERAGGGSLNKKDKKRYRRTRRSAFATVQTIYKGLFFDPEVLDGALRKSFTVPARRAWHKATPGIPSSTRLLKTTKRWIRLGMLGARFKRAAAKVMVVARLDGRRRSKIVHNGTLWLERKGPRWQVIAFRLDQQRHK